MATDDVKRKLTAIFSADVVGYSRLMGDDELATVQTLTSYKETMTKLIKHYRGRVLDAIGDNLMAEFASVVDAVQCAVEVQQVLSSKNEDLPENRKMLFRIGINLGDVIEEGDRIYGDGVNIAARVESLAEEGGVCISGSAFEQIENKLALGYQYMGEHTVKNIVKPVKVYKVPMGPLPEKEKKIAIRGWHKVAAGVVAVLIIGIALWVLWNQYWRPTHPPIEVASVEKMAFPLPDKPSIAVLPFVNMSGDPEQEYFSDGLTEEIISALSRVPKVFVIARNSTFTYKGRPVKVQQVSEELGVRYVLEGSVRKAEDRVRITAQLIDATTGRHLWSERYDRDLKDIFALQDEVTMKIITALQVELTEGEKARLWGKGTRSLEAYIKYLQGYERLTRRSKEDNAVARQIAREAIELDPNYAPAYALLATTYMMDIWLKSTKSPKRSLTQAIELTQKSIALDDSFSRAHALLGWLYTMARQHEKGIAECERAVALSPNFADAHTLLGLALRYAGRHEEAVRASETAVRLNPFPNVIQLTSMGMAYYMTGRYDEAIAACRKAVSQSPDDPNNHLALAVAYVGAGLDKEAHVQIEEILRIAPKYSLEYVKRTLPFKNSSDMERVIKDLRTAGLPETPPLPLPDKPSIAVLPFVNMSGDPEQEYFSDGITEEIITALSKTPKLFVIARHSSFTYKGKPIWVPKVGKELGVKYVLEGSVRRAEDKLRITAQLIDAKTNQHLWAERYDRDMRDIFAVQDEITKEIITALQVKLTEGEQARVYSRGTTSIEAYLKLLKGREQLNRFNKQGNALARQTIEQAIALDPQYPIAYLLLAITHHRDVLLRSTSTPKKSIAKAIELAQKTVALDESLAEAHGFLASAFSLSKQYEKAVAQAERAVALNPNSADAHFYHALSLNYSAGKHEEAIAVFKKAIRLNPIPPLYQLLWLAIACRDAGRYEEAIPICRKILRQQPDYLFAHTCLASCYALMDRGQEARAEAAEVLRIDPKFSVDYIVGRTTYKYEVDRNRLRDSLLKAGLPE